MFCNFSLKNIEENIAVIKGDEQKIGKDRETEIFDVEK